jgi:hypothetical protein
VLCTIASRHRGSLLLLLAAAPLLGACASRAGGKATEGALEALRTPPAEGEPRIAEVLGRYTAEGALGELSSPRGLDRIATVVDATVTRSLEAALRSSTAAPGRGGGSPAPSLVDRMARDSAASFAAAFSDALQRALGPDGRGPLAVSLGATVGQVSGSAVRGARGELDDLFPGCDVEDRRACLESEVKSLGRAAASGFMEGIFGSAAWPVLALAFLVGVAAALVMGGTWRLLRRQRHAEAREAHSHS